MLCCFKKTGETKSLSKPLLSEPKSLTGEPKFPAEPKYTAERKLTGFESMPVPEPKAKIEFKEVKNEPIEAKKEEEIKEVEEIVEITKIKEPEEPLNYQEFSVIAKPEPPSIIELNPEIIIKPEPRYQQEQQQEQQKQRNEKKRSKSGRR